MFSNETGERPKGRWRTLEDAVVPVRSNLVQGVPEFPLM